MKLILVAVWISIGTLTLLLEVPPALAVVHSFTEDFSSKEYCDTANTTALWDTLNGEVKFPPFYPTLAGSIYTPGTAWDVEVDGDYAYVAAWGSGLQIVDINDPDSLEVVGACGTPGLAHAVALSGDYAYVADYTSGVQVIDITDPANPFPVGSYATAGTAMDVAISGDYAYVACATVGVYVLNITIPPNPVPAGFCGTPGSAEAIVVAGDYAYVADNTSGLQVLNISSPTTPYIAGAHDTPGYAYGLAVDGDYAYVADYSSGLQVVDISDPTSPYQAGNEDTPGLAWQVAITGDYACMADGTAGVQVIDISDPTSPSTLQTYDTPDWAYAVDIDGHHAYVADRNNGLQVVEIAKPFYEVRMGADCLLPDNPGAIVVSGDYAFAMVQDDGISVIDIGDPFSPAVVGNCVSPSGAYYSDDPVLHGDMLFVPINRGLEVIDVSTPTSPACVGSLYIGYGYGANGFAVAGDYGYLGHSYDGIYVVDVSLASAPAIVETCATPGEALTVTVSGNYAYVGDGHMGLQVLDITTPTAPVIVGNYDDGLYSCGRIKISGDLAFAGFGPCVRVLDVSDPPNPSLLGSYAPDDHNTGWAVTGNLLYMSGYHTGGYEYDQISVFDITDPSTYVRLGYMRPDERAMKFGIAGDFAYFGSLGSLRVYQFFYRLFDELGDRAQSTEFQRSSEEIKRVRLTTAQVDSIGWEVVADTNAFFWNQVLPGAGWQLLDWPGQRLIWRSTHRLSQIKQNPSCSMFMLEWLYSFAFIDSIVDVPSDQGGWVRIYFTRSTLDFADEPTYPVEAYDIYRRIDDVEFRERVVAAREETCEETQAGEVRKCIEMDGRTFALLSGDSPAASPPGVWEVLGTVHAHQQDQYIYLAPTLADSSSSLTYSVYCISTETTTPSVYYFSPPDSGYSVDNLAPSPPPGLTMASPTELDWGCVPETDFDYFTVYGSEDPAPNGSETLIGYTIDTYIDVTGHVYTYYHVTATDFSGNEGDPSSIENTFVGVPAETLPAAFALMQNRPNPFAARTVIRFDLPEPEAITLTVFDVEGRVVARLTEGIWKAGRHSVQWDGRDEAGRQVSPGLYFVYMKAAEFSDMKKMMLLH
jgi:hypothetical protein